jgi:hypothetical protein
VIHSDHVVILNDELQQNFRISTAELQKVASDKERVQVKVSGMHHRSFCNHTVHFPPAFVDLSIFIFERL